MSRVLITGGAGFIGSAVARAALARGWTVRVFDNFSNGYEANLPPHPSLTIVRGDVRDRAAVIAALDDVDTVFHLAAIVGNIRSLEQPVEDADTNVIGTRTLLHAMREAGVDRLVYSSSSAIFGEPVRMPIGEGHQVEPQSPYGVSKLAGEKDVLCFGRAYDWTVAALRYFNAYGPNQRFDAYGNVIPIFATRLMEGRRLTIYGDGKQTRDFVHVDDIAEANCLAAEGGAQGPFNIGSGAATTIERVARVLQQAMGVTAAVEHAAPRPGEVLHSVADISRARSVLGYAPRYGLDAGLRTYAAWIKDAV